MMMFLSNIPFSQTIASPNCTLEKATEQIDVGGPTHASSRGKEFQSGYRGDQPQRLFIGFT
ncbi:hypothetical protein [Coxiella-like endosymbiont]|uniref:hypothetical protein n=1 Tax=Coxiella-like endosymbiont TaxID=1592897 RepID=UPI00272BF3BD|nr:hypothetical protein [Coxiella-like endosymbiont]